MVRFTVKPFKFESFLDIGNTQYFLRNSKLCTQGKHILQHKGSLGARSDPRDQSQSKLRVAAVKPII